MRQEIFSRRITENGNPTGGTSWGLGITIHWQDGPLGNPLDMKKHNGAFVEGVIQCALDRLEFFQDSKFKCEENAEAIRNLQFALAALDARTKDRKERGVEGLHKE